MRCFGILKWIIFVHYDVMKPTIPHNVIEDPKTAEISKSREIFHKLVSLLRVCSGQSCHDVFVNVAKFISESSIKVAIYDKNSHISLEKKEDTIKINYEERKLYVVLSMYVKRCD